MSNFLEVIHPYVDFSKFSTISRDEGISGFIRARNEGEFLAFAIESWLPLLDELVIVYNNCQDNTANIAQEYANKYPNKIKVYHYVPIVYPQGSDKYKGLPPDNYHSLVNYYNFSLAKTTKKWAVKIDGDLILIPEKIQELRQLYEKLKYENPRAYIPISGINIIKQKNKIYVPSLSKFCGLNGDLCLFKVGEDTVFKKALEFEYLDLKKRKKLTNNFAYYHLKFCKNDFGLSNYEFDNNPNSRYLPQMMVFLLMTKFIPLSDILLEIDDDILSDSIINNLSIVNHNSYKVSAFRYLNVGLSDISKIDLINEWVKILWLNSRIRNNVKMFFNFIREKIK